jgi:hypothetical protein
VKIYGVQVGKDLNSTEFFKTITEMSGGEHMHLTEVENDSICKTIASVYHKAMEVPFSPVSVFIPL